MQFSYYIQTNGHTEAGSCFVVEMSLKPGWVVFSVASL